MPEQLSLFKADSIRPATTGPGPAKKSEDVENKKQFAELLLSKLNEPGADTQPNTDTRVKLVDDRSRDPQAELQAQQELLREQQRQFQNLQLQEKVQDTRL